MSNINQVSKNLRQDLITKVNQLEKALGSKGLWINSAYRSPEYNASIGGAKNSYHTKGMAVDISRNSFKQSPEEFEKIARSLGFGGVGFYDAHVHVDIGPKNRFWDNRTGKGTYDKAKKSDKEQDGKIDVEAIVKEAQSMKLESSALTAFVIGAVVVATLSLLDSN